MHAMMMPTILFLIALMACNICCSSSTSLSVAAGMPSSPSQSSAEEGVKQALTVLGVVEEAKHRYLGEKEERVGSCVLPFLTVSFAQTLDGSIAPLNRSRLDISSNCSFRLLHSLRARHDAVLVGINTLLCDTPRLNVRDPLPGVLLPSSKPPSPTSPLDSHKQPPQPQQPRPVVIDGELRILDVSDLRVEAPIVCTCVEKSQDDACATSSSTSSSSSSSGRRYNKWQGAMKHLQKIGGEKSALVQCQRDGLGRCDLRDSLHALKIEHGITSVLVEGGAGIIQSVLEQELAHMFVVTVSPCFFGGYRAMTQQLRDAAVMKNARMVSLGKDFVLCGEMTNSA